MKQSSNLGLALYDKTDLMNITGLENSLNHNMELIDSEISQLSQKKADLGGDGKVPKNQLPAMDYAPSTHASQHVSGGSDPITPASIGAAAASHTHDDSYYTEAEINALLQNKVDKAGDTMTGFLSIKNW